MRKSTHTISLGGLLIALATLSSNIATAGSHPLDSLPVGYWFEAPNSALREVCPADNLYGGGYDWSFHCRNVIGAWSGGAYDTTRDRLFVWGGGHGDYAGNEVYVFDVEALAWQRLNDPSNLDGFCDGGACPQEAVMPDGRPPSVHSYDGLQYLPTRDQLWSHGGSLWRSGNIHSLTWSFSPDTLQWTRLADAPDTKASVASAYDPLTGQVYLHGNTTLTRHDPATNQWTTLTDSQASYPLRTTAAIDPVRRLMIMIGGGNAYYYDLTQPPPMTRNVLVTTGANEIISGESPGLEYDSVNDQLVAWSGEPDRNLSSTDVYLLNLDTLNWTRRAPAPGNVVTPTNATATGTFGRFRYIPSRNVFIVVSHVDANVFFYRLSANPGIAVFADGFEARPQPPEGR